MIILSRFEEKKCVSLPGLRLITKIYLTTPLDIQSSSTCLLLNCNTGPDLSETNISVN